MGDGETDDLGLGSLLRDASVPRGDAERVRALGDQRRRRGAQARAVIGVLLVAVVLAGVAVAVRRDGSSTVDSVGSTSSAAPGSSVPRVGDPAAVAELPTRPVPDGWQTIDYGDIRFSVPGDWEVGVARTCPAAGKIVSLGWRSDGLNFCPLETTPFHYVVVIDEATPTGSTSLLGDVPALRDSRECTLPSCGGYWVPGGARVVAVGLEADAIYATLTWSARYRALHAGPLLDTTGWQTIDEDGVRFKAPAEWPVTRLTKGDSGLDPGQCSGVMFGEGHERRVVIGSTGIVAKCPAPVTANTRPADGVWLSQVDATTAQSYRSDPATPHGAPLGVPVIEMTLRSTISQTDDQAFANLKIGAGPDPAVARTILFTLGVAPGSAEPTSASTTTTSPSTNVGSAELPTRPVPDGWQTIDHGDLRFSVPGDWELLTSVTSPCVGAGSVVLMKRMDDMTNCPMNSGGITPFVEVRPGALADATVATKFGDLDAKQGPPIPRPCCINLIAQIDEWIVSIEGGQGADASAIADTFTRSARYRALHNGPLLDTSGWRTVTEQGVQFEVPSDWPTIQLTGSNRTNPGACVGRPFGPADERQVFVGMSATEPECASASSTESPPTDGVWVRGMAADPDPGVDPSSPLEHREQHGLAFDINPTIAVSQVLLVVADVGTAPGRDQPRTSVVIGVGLDPAIARTILASLRPAPS
jgi:hypothetical protein